MREPINAEPPAMPLHATWFQVMAPRRIALPNGQPAYEVVQTVETLAEATHHVSRIPGGAIVLNVAVFINPRLAAPPGVIAAN